MFHILFRDEHQLIFPPYVRQNFPESGAEYALDAISFHRDAVFFGHGHAEPRLIGPADVKERQGMRKTAFSGLENAFEIAVFLQPVLHFYPFLRGKFFTTLVSSSLQDVSAALRRHSLTESVDFTSLSFLGLIGSFHDS